MPGKAFEGTPQANHINKLQLNTVPACDCGAQAAANRSGWLGRKLQKPAAVR